MKVIIKPRSTKPSKRFPITLDLDTETATVSQLKQHLATQAKISVHRQRLTTADKKVLDDPDATLKSLGVVDGDALEIKDLGPQISWRTVFLTEYFGPLFIHPIFYFGQKLIYGKTFEHSQMQTVALGLILAHYAKRELETILYAVTSPAKRSTSSLTPSLSFSIQRPPILVSYNALVQHHQEVTLCLSPRLLTRQADIPPRSTSSGHYWGLSGLLIAIPLYGPWNSASSLSGTLRSDPKWIYGTVGVWAFAQISNLITHLNLRSLRPAGTRARGIPKGYGFDLVSCPNYFFEGVGWTAFLALTFDYGAAIFLAVATAQMYVWAVKKHSRYRKEFGKEYPRGRKAMFPFVA